MTDRFLNGPDENQALADEKASGTVNWYFTDNQGTVRDVAQYNSGTNTTSIVDHLKFDSFGNITAQSNSANQPLFAFTGQMLDSYTGLYWYHARWYDPHTGRFISQDPSGFNGQLKVSGTVYGLPGAAARADCRLQGQPADRALGPRVAA